MTLALTLKRLYVTILRSRKKSVFPFEVLKYLEPDLGLEKKKEEDIGCKELGRHSNRPNNSLFLAAPLG